MKKIIYIIGAIAVLVIIFLIIKFSAVKTYFVNFDSDGGTEIRQQEVEKGKCAVEPKEPTKDGYEFICWLYNNSEFDFTTSIVQNITLKAKWQEVKPHIHIYDKEVVLPTCENKGYTLYICECGEMYKDNYDSLGHDLVERPKVEPTCTEIGCEAYVECTRCSFSTYKELPALGHDLVEYSGKDATNLDIGWKPYAECNRCDYSTYEELPVLPPERIELDIFLEDYIKYIYYGSYPQTHINDRNLLSVLNSLTETNERGYYEFEGIEYAKVAATPCQYGEIYCDFHKTTHKEYVYSDGSEVKNNRIEWFRVEPIKWRILSEENGNYHILSEYILTAHNFHNDTTPRLIDDVTIYANDYKYSDIRSFLNNDFLYSAFSEIEHKSLVPSELNNTNEFDLGPQMIIIDKHENTFDKLFLLSVNNSRNSGFYPEGQSTKVTDYAKATGAYWERRYCERTYTTTDNGSWMLRDHNTVHPTTDNLDVLHEDPIVYIVSREGKVTVASVRGTSMGVRPSTVIALK